MEHIQEADEVADLSTVEERVRDLEQWRSFVRGAAFAAGLVSAALQGIILTLAVYCLAEVQAERKILHQVAIKVGVPVE